MAPTDLIWLLLLLSTLQPILRQRLLEAARGRLRRQLETARASRVILLVHRQETMSLFGIPLMRFIDIQDAEEVLRAIRETAPDTPIDLILHTPGGLVLPSLQIARALARHPAKVTAFVPHYAMSGGTLIALAAAEIVLSEHAVLGPIDPQIDDFPAASILRAVERNEAKDVDDHTLILADQAAMAVTQLRDAIKFLIGTRVREDVAENAANALSEGRWTHDYPITPAEAAMLGLPISTVMPAAVLQMMNLYAPVRRRSPSVEYGVQRGRA